VDVQEASDQLGLVVGLSTTEDLLGRNFTRQCIGNSLGVGRDHRS
jgi:tRNA U34 5-carboxymethylaminomethyl modifying GTPase MnmE/TrmE